jgi:flavin reductase (DIM6/NTAB) family NADH-FMN oxidoreductase RutF
MTVAWGGICCSAPPCVAVSVRKATYTFGNLISQKCFTVNIPSEKQIKEADYFGMVSGKHEQKFKVTGLTPIKSEKINAPYIKEFPLILECRLIHTIELGLHTQFIGEIIDVMADSEALTPSGLSDIEKVRPLIFDPELHRYFGIGNFLGKAFEKGSSLLNKPS